MSGEQPVPHPVLTSALIDELVEESERVGRKPTALGTSLRYSNAGSCLRKIGYDAQGLDATEPMDDAGLWITSNGTIHHERVQAAIGRRFPEARFEVASRLEDVDCSGSADALVPLDDGLAVYELKNVNGTHFAQAIGVDRKGYKRTTPKGPRWSAKIQGSLNAFALDAEFVVIAYLATEAVSKQLAARLGLSERDRFMAEWVYPRSIWESWAYAEIERLKIVEKERSSGHQAPRVAVDDNGSDIVLNPNASRVPWNCAYCSHLSRCTEDGPDPAPLS